MTVTVPGYTETQQPGTTGGNTTGATGYDDYSGSSAATGTAGEKKRAMQSYLYVIYNLYGKKNFSPLQQKLAERAFNMRWGASQYAEMLRRQDPKYVKSADYRERIQAAKDLYQSYRPGRPVPVGFLKAYAHSNMSTARLQEKIENSKWFKREFAGWTEAQKAGSAAGMSPQTFLNYKTMWNNALLRAYGRQATPLEQRMMFSAGMTGDEVANNMAELFGGQEALKWATGGALNRQKIIEGALTNKFGTNTLNQVRQSRATQAGFLGSKNRDFSIDADQQGMLRLQGI